MQSEPSPTAQNGSLDMRQPEMSRTYHERVLIVYGINFVKRGFHQIDKSEIVSLKSQM